MAINSNSSHDVIQDQYGVVSKLLDGHLRVNEQQLLVILRTTPGGTLNNITGRDNRTG